MQHCDAEPTMMIVLVNVLEYLEYFWNHAVCKLIVHLEIYLPT